MDWEVDKPTALDRKLHNEGVVNEEEEVVEGKGGEDGMVK